MPEPLNLVCDPPPPPNTEALCQTPPHTPETVNNSGIHKNGHPAQHNASSEHDTTTTKSTTWARVLRSSCPVNEMQL